MVNLPIVRPVMVLCPPELALDLHVPHPVKPHVY